jgi:hypothetical protein
MAIKGRLTRLEAILARDGGPGRRTFDRFMADHVALRAWLDDCGYPDSLAALEAGETGPAELQDLLREQATHDPHIRAWARVEAALNEGQLPDDADLRLRFGTG